MMRHSQTLSKLALLWGILTAMTLVMAGCGQSADNASETAPVGTPAPPPTLAAPPPPVPTAAK